MIYCVMCVYFSGRCMLFPEKEINPNTKSFCTYATEKRCVNCKNFHCSLIQRNKEIALFCSKYIYMNARRIK